MAHSVNPACALSPVPSSNIQGNEWLDMAVGPGSPLPEIAPNDLERLPNGHVSLLCLPVMDEIGNLLEISEKQTMKLVIRGAAGTGKSCLMLYAVHEARRRGWVVLYIPQGKLYKSHWKGAHWLEFANIVSCFLAKRMMNDDELPRLLRDFFDYQLNTSRDTLQSMADTDPDAKEALDVLKEYSRNRPEEIEDCINMFRRYVNCIKGIKR
jgi:Mitochondrial ribosomal death-associated protein 3